MENIHYSTYAFISYSRRDKTIANWLLHKLEDYAYPRDMVDTPHRPPHNKFIRPVFLDTEDLQVEERKFSDSLKEKLRQSRYLIVLCSRHSAESPFVDMEIKYFLESHNNNYSLIIPLFIDEVKGSIPPAFEGTSIMERHFPIYNSVLGTKSHVNIDCVMHLISYMLGVDYATIYNRYEESEKRQLRRKSKIIAFMSGLLFVCMAMLGVTIFYKIKSDGNYRRFIEKQRERVEFERQVFPAAIVFGYEKNFLSPVINYIKEQKREPEILILLPDTEKKVRDHQNRLSSINMELGKIEDVDSAVYTHLPTSMKRGSRIIQFKGGKFDNQLVYLDLATTTSSFLEVAQYKKLHRDYRWVSTDSIIQEYSHDFAKICKDKLEDDSVYVNFFYSTDDLISYISEHK